MKFFTNCFEYHKASIFVVFMILIMGINIYVKIPRELNPDMKIAFLNVKVSLDGITVEDSEKLLLRPLEKQLKAVNGVKEMSSIAGNGYGSISLEFDAGYNIDKALNDVRVKVELAKSDLPRDANSPIISEFNMSELPILSIGLLSDEMPEKSMLKIAEQLKNKLEGINEVLNVEIVGKLERIVEIILDKKNLEHYNLDFDSAIRIIKANNLMVNAGKIIKKKGDFVIEVSGMITDIQDILDFPITFDSDYPLKVKDIATVLDKMKTPESMAKFNGKNTMVLKIAKKSGANLLSTIAKVKYLIGEAKVLLPENLEIIYSQDVSAKIFNILSDLENNIIFAIVLVFAIIALFLGLRPAIFVACSIPISFLMSILLINYLGYTLNIVVLFSLILSVGILVDNAIVIVEYAQKKILAGHNKRDSFFMAIKDMTVPLFSSTLTTIVVFLPLMFWPGMIGKFMFYLPITLISALSSSLISALVFIPAFGKIFGKKSAKGENVALEEGDFSNLNWFYRNYKKILDWVLSHPKMLVTMIAGLSVAIVFSYVVFGRGVEFFPNVEPDNAFIDIRARGNFSIHEKKVLVEKVESLVFKYQDDIDNVFTEIGSIEDDVIGRIIVEFADWKVRRKAREILSDIRMDSKAIPGIVIEVMQEQKMGNSKSININISSYDQEKLGNHIDLIKNLMDKVGGFINIEDDRGESKVTLDVQIDRAEAAKYGVTVAQIGGVVRLLTDNGLLLTTYKPFDAEKEIDIVVKLTGEQNLITEIDNLNINTSLGKIPLSNFITVVSKKGVDSLRKINGVNAYSVKANVEPGIVVDNQLKKLNALLNKTSSDPEVMVDFAGENKDQEEAKNFLQNAFLIALAMVILIITIQFNSFYHTFVILTSVFFSTVGVYLGLLATGRPFGIVMCGVGIVTLVGVVVNNNIILIDSYHCNLRRKICRKDAIMIAAISRLRPILLTAGTTILGLLPMIFCTSFDFFQLEVNFNSPSGQWWTQLSTSIGGGLLFATVITLFFTPAMLTFDCKKSCNN